MERARLAEELRRRGIRVTAQRLAVAEAVVGTHEHLTAQEIFERVRERFPHITIGTIYNTLEVLTATGIVQPLPFPRGTRYDTNLEPHVNLVCIRCGHIEDYEDEKEALQRLAQEASRKAGFHIVSQHMDIYGFCAACAS
jgi:Fur family peroxide stress response transcriptional regulator